MGALIPHIAPDTAIPLLTALINLLAAVANVASRFTGPAVAGAASVHPDANPARLRPDA